MYYSTIERCIVRTALSYHSFLPVILIFLDLFIFFYFFLFLCPFCLLLILKVFQSI